LGELLQALAPSFSFPRQSNSGLGDHVRAAQLRGRLFLWKQRSGWARTRSTSTRSP
jgi:hypothetical protein